MTWMCKIGQDIRAMTITVTDGSGKCPDDYQNSQPVWDATNNTFTILL